MGRNRIIDLANFPSFQAINVLSDPGHIGGKVIIPNCAQITVRWTLEDGKVAHNVLYGRYTGTFNGSQAQANAIMSNLVAGSNWSSYNPFLSTTTALAGVDIRNVNVKDQPLISSSLAAAAGTSASPALPNETAIVLTLRTGNSGQSGRGRIYLPGHATNGLGAGNVIASALVTAATNFGQNFLAAINNNGYQFVLGLPKRNGYTGITGTVHDPRDATSVPILTVICRNNSWDSQRRRGLK